MSEYRSSVSAFEEFEKTALWQDIKYELGLWLEEIRSQLEDPEGKLAFGNILRLQGSAEAVRNMLDLPHNVAENIKEDLEREMKKDE